MKTYISIIFFFISGILIAQMNSEHLKIGDEAPLILAKDQNGKEINSANILKEHQILLIFYRGNWCPYCNQHLSSLHERLKEFEEKGVFVLVVSPEKVSKTVETGSKYDNEFSVVHDTDNKIMTDYKVAFEVNEKTVPMYYEKLQVRLAEYNESSNMVLPVPATYLIDRTGKITYVHFDPNYKERSNLDEILKSL